MHPPFNMRQFPLMFPFRYSFKLHTKFLNHTPNSAAQYSSSIASASADFAMSNVPPHTPISPSSASAPSTSATFLHSLPLLSLSAQNSSSSSTHLCLWYCRLRLLIVPREVQTSQRDYVVSFPSWRCRVLFVRGGFRSRGRARMRGWLGRWRGWIAA